MDPNPEVAYLPDSRVDEAMDRDLRRLLTACFTKPEQAMFQTRRYWREPYPHRWVIRGAEGALAAHAGVHEKEVESGGRRYRIGGLCEVCTHPDYRGRGYVKVLLARIHAFLAERGFAFAMLFGNPRVYGSSGYVPVANLVCGSETAGWKPVTAMVHSVAGIPWPESEVRLTGPTF